MAAPARLVPALSGAGTGPHWAAALAAVLTLSGFATTPGIVMAPPGDVQSAAPAPAPSGSRPATPPAPASPPKASVLRAQTGTASWYGQPHHGRLTASGEAFNMHALTAAHPWLPLGTRVRVTNLGNSRTVNVRVNDRGPIVPGRIIDLSHAAAHALDGVDAGVFTVRLRVLHARGGDPSTSGPDAWNAWSASMAAWLWALAPATAPPPMPAPVTPEMPEGARARSTRLPSRRS